MKNYHSDNNAACSVAGYSSVAPSRSAFVCPPAHAPPQIHKSSCTAIHCTFLPPFGRRGGVRPRRAERSLCSFMQCKGRARSLVLLLRISFRREGHSNSTHIHSMEALVSERAFCITQNSTAHHPFFLLFKFEAAAAGLKAAIQ